jgi:hypothetical protein
MNDLDLIKQLRAQVAWFQKVYLPFEESRPRDVPRGQFVKWCFDAWEEKCELDQAYEYLFENGWKLLINQLAGGQVSALSICVSYSRVDQRADGSTRAKAIIRLAAKVTKSTEVAETKEP